MRYLITMTVDIEEVREKVTSKKPSVVPEPEAVKPAPVTTFEQLVFGIKDAAVALGISRTSIFNLIKEGQLPVVKLGRRTLIPARELRVLIETLQQR
jgi:excisionase family DNA binding protein